MARPTRRACERHRAKRVPFFSSGKASGTHLCRTCTHMLAVPAVNMRALGALGLVTGQPIEHVAPEAACGYVRRLKRFSGICLREKLLEPITKT